MADRRGRSVMGGFPRGPDRSHFDSFMQRQYGQLEYASEDMRRKIAVLEKRNKKLEEENTRLKDKQVTPTTTNLKSQVALLEKQNKKLEGANARLKREREDIGGKLLLSENRKRALEQETARLQTASTTTPTTVKTENVSLEKRYKALKQEMDKLRIEKEEDNAALQERIDALENENAIFVDEKARLNTDIVNLRSLLSETQRELATERERQEPPSWNREEEDDDVIVLDSDGDMEDDSYWEEEDIEMNEAAQCTVSTNREIAQWQELRPDNNSRIVFGNRFDGSSSSSKRRMKPQCKKCHELITSHRSEHIATHLNLRMRCPVVSCSTPDFNIRNHLRVIHNLTVADLNEKQKQLYDAAREAFSEEIKKVKHNFFSY